MNLKPLLVASGIAAALLIQGCAPTKYVVKNPTPSEIQFEAVQDKKLTKPSFVDNRSAQGPFAYGVLPTGLELDGKPLNEFSFLTSATMAELKARGIDVENAANDIQVSIEKFNMRNHRTNAYTPFITFTMLKANVKTANGSKPIVAYVKRGKVPVWSFSEIVEPTLNDPLALVVKEFSAKLNQELYQAKTSDDKVNELIDYVNNNPKDDNLFKKVYELGFSNNAKALPTLRQLTEHDDEYVRLAAISSLGILKDVDSLEMLKSLYTDSKTWSDRAMALKAIGDLGTMPAVDFLNQEYKGLETSTTKEDVWNREIIELYLYYKS